ncbi:MAG: ureidoglycolate lyase [Novosphingobium sp.]
MDHFEIEAVLATPENVAPFGHYIGAAPGVPVFTEWPGTVVHGTLPIELDTGGEMLLVTADARPFPVQCGLIERHFKHTQTYLPFNGKSFVMVLGEAGEADVPDYAALRAMLFCGAGIILHKGIWHDFPYAIEDATQFAVALRSEAHVNTDAAPAYPMDADGPDLQRREIRPRAAIFTRMPDTLLRTAR